MRVLNIYHVEKMLPFNVICCNLDAGLMATSVSYLIRQFRRPLEDQHVYWKPDVHSTQHANFFSKYKVLIIVKTSPFRAWVAFAVKSLLLFIK